jgi:hypothetical protein
MIGQSGTSVDVEAVAVGMTVLALDLEGDTDADLQDVRGGVVIAVDTHRDVDTGEIQRVFLTAKQWRREIRWAAIRADEVRQVLEFNSATVRRLVRAMGAHLGAGKGAFVTVDRQLIQAMHALREVI